MALRGLAGADTCACIDLPDALPLIRTDAGLLERVVANLVANALRLLPAGQPGTGHAGPAMSPAASCSRSIDHGPGVPERARERIFEPFQRLDDRGTGTGVGLGLAVARGFTEPWAARCAARTPGGGLTMRVDPARSRRTPATCPVVGRPVTRVLVVDDEPPILRALSITLTARDYHVSTAADGTVGPGRDGP